MVRLLLFAGAALNLVSVIPYLLDVIKGKTKPRVVSWLIWGTLGLIAGAAAVAGGAIASAILSFTSVAAVMTVVVLGYKNSDKKFGKLDIFSLIGAGVGLLLWWLFNAPIVALFATVTIDIVGTLPTMWHAWQKPYEETVSAFFMGFLSATFLLIAALSVHSIEAVLVPLYIASSNAVITTIIISRRSVMQPVIES